MKDFQVLKIVMYRAVVITEIMAPLLWFLPINRRTRIR